MPQAQVFIAKTLYFGQLLIDQSSDRPSINVFEVEAIFLVFELWTKFLIRHWVIIYTDSLTAESGFLKNTLISKSNALLREFLLLISKYDIVLEACWIKSKKNGLVDAFSRFDKKKVANLCLH